MASKCRPQSEVCLRKITKPVISTDVMGNRNVEVRAVGAWVQPASSVPSEGVIAAVEEEARIRQMQYEKEARLQKFKEDVKHRVRAMEKARKKEQIEKNYRASEHERKVVRQSAFTSESVQQRRSNSAIQRNQSHAIKQVSLANENVKQREENTSCKAFHDQTNQIHQYTSLARRKLGSKQLNGEDFVADDLPGGVWKVSKTRDHPASRSFGSIDDEELEDTENCRTETNHKIIIPTGDENESMTNDDMENARLKLVQFDLEPRCEESRQERISKKPVATTFTGTQVIRTIPHVSATNLYLGVQSEEEKRQRKSEHATYRRLFMDIEREQVKENLRRKEHRKRIQRLKKEKEEERKSEEQVSRSLIEPRDPMTGETSMESLQREIQLHRQMRETMKQNEERHKKIREMERYLDALRAQLREKIDKKGILLPPLCCCGTTVWDTNPETCANNCIFYKNPKGFVKALQSLLASCDVA